MHSRKERPAATRNKRTHVLPMGCRRQSQHVRSTSTSSKCVCLCRPYIFLINYEHVIVLLVTTVVFRANYQYISLDSMEKFLSYASNGISFSIGIEMNVISLPMIFMFL